MKTNLTKEIEKSIILTNKATGLSIYSCLEVGDKIKRVLSMRYLFFLKWADIVNTCNRIKFSFNKNKNVTKCYCMLVIKSVIIIITKNIEHGKHKKSSL